MPMITNTIMSRMRLLDHALDEIKECAENRLGYETNKSVLLEDLALMRGTRDEIVDTLQALDNALTSLEYCGFSQEWLDCINIDGSFSDCTGVDALKLIGSDDKKFDACCESIISSIWEFLKTLWKWIYDAVKKIYEFLRKFFACVSNDYDAEQKVRNLLASAVTKGKIHPGNFKDILKEINDLSGGKFYDISKLAERIGVDIACGAWLTEYSVSASRPVISDIDKLLRKIGSLSVEQAGTQAIDLNNKLAAIVGCKSADTLVEDAQAGVRKNYIVEKLEDVIASKTRSQPIRSFPVSNKGGMSFRAGSASDVKNVMTQNKMELVNGNEGCRIELFDFAESAATCDYVEKILTVDKFVMFVDAVSNAHNALFPLLQVLIKNGQYLEADVSAIKKMIPIIEGLYGVYSQTGDARCSEAWRNLVIVVRSISIQLSEVLNISTRLYSDMNMCHNAWRKFNAVIEKRLK